MAETPKTSPKSLAIAEGEIVLALDCQALLAADGPLPMPGVIHRDYSDLGADLLARIAPTRVILPLFTTGHDAVAAIEALERLGFGGLITVIGPDLPRPRLVERELRAAGPGQRLTLISP